VFLGVGGRACSWPRCKEKNQELDEAERVYGGFVPVGGGQWLLLCGRPEKVVGKGKQFIPKVYG